MRIATMKVLVVTLGLIIASLQSGKRGCQGEREGARMRMDCGVPSTQLTGVAVVASQIRVYGATGERRNDVIMGTRVLLTCEVTGLTDGHEVVTYRWYHSCNGHFNSRCEIRAGDPYYRAVNDTLLVDVISWYREKWYFCTVHYQGQTTSLTTRSLPVAGLCTPLFLN